MVRALKLKIVFHNATKFAIALPIVANKAAIINTDGKQNPAILAHGVSMFADQFGDKSRFVRFYFSGDVELLHVDGNIFFDRN